MVRITFLVVSAVSVSVLVGCGASSIDSFGSVHGVVLVDAKPASPGTRIRFRHRQDPTTTFYTMVDDSGGYSYRPPQEAPLKSGEYEIAVEPLTTTTKLDESGLSVETVIRGAPKNYGKYSQLSQSGLAATLTSGKVKCDIDITSR
ncbi:hypothetical protein M4951_20700 [Blastopirellula sp. J2-11]|uniref:hypothetical protein n=1 Tax=Blastopirellula sp. J2-11 TaxID=2943192 RepID=UPI0021C630EC|nr:hypothetical protein [Blastopirellula sp. J2-11]UUO05778.1 hypothetical protein M4951_20700 [Blastopirellula sp. J2-11]